MCPPPLRLPPCQPQEPLDPAEGPRLWGLPAYKARMEQKTQRGGGEQCPTGPRSMVTLGSWGVDPVCVRCERGI